LTNNNTIVILFIALIHNSRGNDMKALFIIAALTAMIVFSVSFMNAAENGLKSKSNSRHAQIEAIFN
jgi:hypothetical protein